jgi:integrase
MNIQERRNKDGKITSYRIRVFDHRDTDTGKKVFKNLSVKYDKSKSESWNRKNAEKQAAIFEKGVEEQTVCDSRITFAEYAEYVIKSKEQSCITSSTAYNYRVKLQKLKPVIGHIQLKDLMPKVLNNAYSELLKAGTSKSYVHGLHGFIRNVMKVAYKEGIVPRNYADAAMPPKRNKNTVVALTEDELNSFYTALFSDEKYYVYQVLFSLLLSMGCRIGKLCALSWSDIDFDEKCIHIHRHFVLDKAGRHVEDGCKTTAGERFLYMDDGIMNMLLEYRQKYLFGAIRNKEWNIDEKAVFSSVQHPGEYLCPNTVRSWIKNFTKKHGLPTFHPHQFRHTSISLQLQAGISVPDIAKRAGHSRPYVTLGIYAHTLRNNDKHISEVVTQAIPQLPKAKEA